MNQLSEFPPLILGNRCLEVLDLGPVLADEYNQGHLRDAADPGVADQLGIERQQAVGLLRIAAGRGLPVDQIALAVEFADRIDIGHEFGAVAKRARHLQLQVLLRLPDVDPIFLRELVKKMDSLMERLIPGMALGVIERRIPVGSPFLEQGGCGILAMKVGGQGLFEAPAEDHRGPGILLPPSVEVAIAIAARAAQVLADLRVAIDHLRSPGLVGSRSAPNTTAPPNRLLERTLQGSERSVRSRSRGKFERRRGG